MANTISDYLAVHGQVQKLLMSFYSAACCAQDPRSRDLATTAAKHGARPAQ